MKTQQTDPCHTNQDKPASVTKQDYNGHQVRIEYFTNGALVYVDGDCMTRVSAPNSPLDWAHDYVDKTVALNAAKTAPPTAAEQFAAWRSTVMTPAQAPQTSHSPLPWSVHTNKETGWPQVISAKKPNGKRAIVALFPAMEENEIKSANAAFIVRACNNAQRLADALKAIADLDLAAVDCGMIPTDTWKRIHAKAREALAQWDKDKQ